MLIIKWTVEITISFLNINKFKGLRQDVNYPELPPQYCHVLQNLHVDDPVGELSVRDGFSDKYDDDHANYPFTTLVSAYEYRFDKPAETRLIVNDNGTLKTMTDGGNPASLTLPTGPGSTATLESGFRNQYLGFKDHVLITTGNAVTNYMLWYGYVKRAAADDKGLFGNAVEKTGYIFTKSQLITPNGVFSDVYNMVYVGGYYWVTFNNSTWIEKRSTDFQLIERFHSYNPVAGGDYAIKVNTNVCLATDGTYIYVGQNIITPGGSETDRFEWYRANPVGFAFVSGTGFDSGIAQTVVGIATDGTEVFICTDVRLYSDVVAGGSLTSESTLVSAIEIACDNTASTGNVFILYAAKVDVRSKDDLNTVDASDTTYLAQKHIEYQDNGGSQSYIFISSTTGDGHVYKFEDDNLAVIVDNTKIFEPGAFLKLLGVEADIRGISTLFGTVEEIAAEDTEYPELIGINSWTTITGDIAAGTYFYKISIEDWDGQFYTLSDPIVVINTGGSLAHELRVICHKDQLTDNTLYRIRNIHIFRGYNSDTDAGIPGTDYKFLKKIDINSASWTEDSNTEVYYYDYTDNTPESTISSTTFLETAGIGDTVKPRYVNPKHIEFIGNKLHAGNFYHDKENYPNRIARSSDDSPDSLPFYDFYDYDVGDGEEIKGISNSFGRTVVFKTRKFKTFYNGFPEKDFLPGLSSESGFTKVNEDLFYVSDFGIHVFNGNKVINIHYPVITLFEAATSYANVAVFYFEKKDRIIFSLENDRSLVYNIKYRLWMHYTSVFAFSGYFKNYANEYIGWYNTKLNILLDSTFPDDNENFPDGPVVGTAIAIDYESPLIRFNLADGETAIPITHRHRLLKGGDTVTFTLYEHRNTSDGKKSVYTQAIAATGGSVTANKSYFFGPLMGEAFSIRLNGNIAGGDFEYNGLTLDYMSGGYWFGRT